MSERRILRILLTFALSLGIAGCGTASKSPDVKSSSGRHFTMGDLPRFDVVQSDLPAGYQPKQHLQSVSARECLGADKPPEVAATFERLGLLGCAGASYRKEVSSDLADASSHKGNTMGSQTFVFKSPTGASQALPELRKSYAESLHTHGAATPRPTSDIPVSGLGDESPPGLRISVDLGPLGPADLYTYFWRRNNVLVLLAASNILNDYDAQSTLKLAHQIDQRIMTG